MLLTEYRLNLVIRALRSILPLEHPADVTLRHFFQHERIGSKERALVAETIFGVLRHRLFLDQACAQEATPRRMALAYWIRFGGYNLRELEPLLIHGESNWLGQVKAISLATLPLPVQAELPEWVIEQLHPTMGDEMILALGRSMQSPAPLDLRVNTLLATRDEILQTFRSEGMDALPTPYSPIGIRLKNKLALAGHPLFLSGKIEVQDEGSQLLGYLLAPRRSDMVVDFCAGAGGKTLMLGAMMQSQGRLYALDVSEKRLANIKPRLKRSGLSNLHPQLISHENDSRIKRLYGKIDRVLVDAPCSGLGTSRRNPDIKFRQSLESVTGYTRMQASILASASKLLKPGGRLVYSTCSFLPQENHAIIDAFLTEHPAFILRPAGEILTQNKILLESKTCLQLLPSLHGTDAFFAAVLERVKTVSPQEI